MVVLDGHPNVWFLAICRECNADVDEPAPWMFKTEAERDAWVVAHRGGTGHDVREALQIC